MRTGKYRYNVQKDMPRQEEIENMKRHAGREACHEAGQRTDQFAYADRKVSILTQTKYADKLTDRQTDRRKDAHVGMSIDR